MSTYDPARRDYFRQYMKKRRSGHPRKSPLSEADIDEIVRLYTVERLGVDPIGRRYDRDGGTIVYYLEKRGIKRRPARGRHDIIRNRRNMQMTGIKTQAVNAAATFYQPTIITFLPDSPQLEADWLATLAAVKAERGTSWREQIYVTRE